MAKAIYSAEQKYLVSQLRKARLEMGLDQRDVAKKLGYTQSYISKIELGQRKIDIFLLRTMAKIYKKPLDYFLK